MSYVLVTGGTGTLGRAVVPLLRAANLRVRILSRAAAPTDCEPGSWVRGNLATGENLDDAVRNVNTIVHLATNPRGTDARLTGALIDAARRGPRMTAPLPHLIYPSIVGVDQIPLGYYRQKLAAEEAVATSVLPFTILRATQFHDLVFTMFAAQRRMPAVLAPNIRLQPIDVRDVAAQLLALVRAGAAGRVADIGGPDVELATDLARATLSSFARAGGSGGAHGAGSHGSVGSRRPIVPLRLPGRTFAAFESGHNLVPSHRVGTLSYADYLVARAAAARLVAEATAPDESGAG
ncbi:NAD-dependent epimerase/dehydratase family protein [Cryobacterium melibiosiphilum]|uniref:NAD-dependent epimerase/dehydratase family protein n=1 Tax=Cryobacterium melibiosiphilum TaxID=995039 RepID=A0A3A5MJW0_9MICO|nr:NAD(P)H-binding protein [Cryobacterium melibiosiphilum]RJT88199.1 NAD-dependent epimerase/dehydratase family protein [Cryobacterium melibiosiphilum]